jgi:hypothetical protein
MKKGIVQFSNSIRVRDKNVMEKVECIFSPNSQIKKRKKEKKCEYPI